MNEIRWKNRLLVLWILQVLNFLAVLVIPESFAAVAEEIGESLGLLIAFYIFMTSLMMWLTVFTSPKLSRWPSIVVGVLYAFVKVQWIFNGLTGEIIPAQFFNEIWGLIAALMIVWCAWKLPEQTS